MTVPFIEEPLKSEYFRRGERDYSAGLPFKSPINEWGITDQQATAYERGYVYARNRAKRGAA